MISDRDQRAFLEFARPPSGTALAYCLGTTFTLDFTLLVQLALATQGEQPEGNSLSLAETFKRLYAFEACSVVYCQSCRIQNIPEELFRPRKTPWQRLLCLLDSAIESVKTTKKEETFHPKVWFLRFNSIDDPRRSVWKLLVTSRNLTEARTWEIGAEFVGVRAQPSASRNGGLIQYLDDVLRKKSGHRKTTRILDQAIHDLKCIDFQLPGQFREWAFLYKDGLNNAFPILDNQRYSKVVAVSPFLSRSALVKLAGLKESLLITDVKDVVHLKGLHALLDNSYLFRLDSYELHAKAYFCRRSDGKGTDVYLGSANLTSAGLLRQGKNIEAMVRLSSRADLVGDFERKFVFENVKKRDPHKWLFKLTEDAFIQSEKEQKEEQKSRIFDEIRAQLSSGTFRLKRTGKGRWSAKWFGPTVTIPKALKALVQFSDVNANYDLRRVLKQEIGFAFTGTPSSLVRISLFATGRTPVVFGTVAEVIGGSRQRSKDLLHQITRESEFLATFKAMVGESADNIPSIPVGEKHLQPGRKHSRNKQMPITTEGYVEALLLADIENPAQRELISNVLESYVEQNNKEALAVQKFWNALVDALGTGKNV